MKHLASPQNLRRRLALLRLVSAAAVFFHVAQAFALPNGATILTAGDSISAGGSTMTIMQSGAKQIINWGTYNIAAGETVTYVQPSSASISLNRVTGGSMSTISGNLNANGQVWLINPSGILFNSTASVNTGSILASTLGIANTDFLTGNYVFSGTPGSLSAITNNGVISAASGGYVAIVAPTVTNSGTGFISANLGKVHLASGDAMTVTLAGNSLVSLAINASASGSGVTNNGLLRANGGQVLISARETSAILQNVVNNQGIIEAKSVGVGANGQIILDGGNQGVINTGTLDASGKGAGETGGTISASGKNIIQGGGTVDVTGAVGNGSVVFSAAGGAYNQTGGTVSAGDVTVTSSGGSVTFGNMNASGTLNVTSAGTVGQYAGTALTVAGAASINAGAADITLANTVNDFQGTVSLTGNNVQVADANALTAVLNTGATSLVAGGALGVSGSAWSLTTNALATNFDTTHVIGSLNVTAGGNVTQNTGTNLTVGGTTMVTMTGAGANVALDQANDLSGMVIVSAAGVGSVNDLNLRNTNAGASVAMPASLHNLTLTFDNAPISLPSETVTGNLSVTAGGAVTQSGSLTVTGTTTVNAGVASITLASAGNDFQNTVNLTGGPTQIKDINALTAVLNNTGATTLTAGGALGVLGNAASLTTNAGSTLFGTTNVTGALNVTSGGTVSQAFGSSLTVGGVASFSSSAGDITLANAGNDFQSAFGVSAPGNISVVDKNTLAVASLVHGANKTVSLVAGGQLTLPAGAIDTGTGNLTLSSGGTLTTPGNLSGNNISLTGANGITVASNVTSGGAQDFNGNVNLGADVVLTSTGAGNITFEKTVDGAHALTVNTAGVTTFAGAVGGGTALTSLTTDVAGATAINGGAITTTGLQDYKDDVTLGGGTTLTSTGGGNITFEKTVNGAQTLVVNTAGVTTFGGAVGNGTALASVTTDAAGSTAINGGTVTTTGLQDFKDDVTLGAGTTLTSTGGGNITFEKTVNGARALTVNTAGVTTFGGAVGGGTALTSLTTDAAGTTALNGGSVTTTGLQDLKDAVTFGADTTMTSTGAGNITFEKTVDGAHALTVNTGGVTTFGGAVGSGTALTSLATNGAGSTAINGGSVHTTGYQEYDAPVTLGADTTVTSNGNYIYFAGTLDGAHALVVNAATWSEVEGAVGNGTALTSLTMNGPLTGLFGGSVKTTGSQDYHGDLYLATDNTLTSTGGGNITFESTVNGADYGYGAHALTVATGGVTTFNGAVGNNGKLTALTVNSGAAVVNGGSVRTTGAQNYVSLSLGANTILNASTVTTSSPIQGGGFDLTLNQSAAHAINGNTFANVKNFATGGGGAETLSGAITTTGTQTYGNAVTLGGAADLTGTTVTLNGVAGGGNDLTVTGNTIFNTADVVGLGNLHVTGTTADNVANISCSGTQNFDQLMTLGASTNLTGSTVTLNGLAGGGHDLTLTGNAVFNTADATSLGNVHVTGTTLDNVANISGSGTQSYDGLVVLGTSANLTGSALTLNGVAGGGNDLTATTNGPGGISINDVIATTGNVTLTANAGAITETGAGAVSAASLATTSVGGQALNGANTVASFNATNSGSGDISFANSASNLTIAGISETAAGNVTVINAGDLTLNNAVSGAGNVTLSTTGAFTNNAGAGAVTAGGRWLVYSADPAGDSKDGLTADFKRYNCTYAGGCLTPGTSVPGSGNGFLYALAPILGVSGSSMTSTYGDTPSFTGVTTSFNGLVDGDTAATAGISGTAGFTSTGTTTSNVGTYNLIADVSGLSSSLGYRFVNDAAGNAGKHTIIPATLTVTADGKTKVYGDSDPALTWQASGFKLSDSAGSVLTGSLVRDFGEAVAGGPYAINQGSLAANPNYTVAYTGNSLTITPATLTVKADSKTKVYGDADPTLTYNASGFKFTDTVAGVLSGGLSRTSGEAVAGGPYAIYQGSLAANPNYTVAYTANNLTINPAPLTVTANSQSKTYGGVDPTLTYNAAGFKFTDTATSVLSGSLTRDPGETVAGGPYAINQGSLAANSNYTVSYTGSTLTINPAPLPVTDNLLVLTEVVPSITEVERTIDVALSLAHFLKPRIDRLNLHCSGGLSCQDIVGSAAEE